jgi:ketosteroid isomerase-like protein
VTAENVAIVRAGYEAFERGDFEAAIAVSSPEAVTHRAPPQPDAGTWHGADGLLRALADWTADMDRFEMTIEGYTDANDTQVIVELRQRAVGRTSGAPVEGTFWLVHTLAERKVVRTDIFAREQHAHELTGLTG